MNIIKTSNLRLSNNKIKLIRLLSTNAINYEVNEIKKQSSEIENHSTLKANTNDSKLISTKQQESKNSFKFLLQQESPLKVINTYKPNLIVLVVDLFDINFQIPTNLLKTLNNQNIPVLITINNFSSLSNINCKLELEDWIKDLIRKNIRINWRGKLIFLDGNTGQNFDLLKAEIDKLCEYGDNVGFMGFYSANVTKLVDNFYKDQEFITERYSIDNGNDTYIRGYNYNLKPTNSNLNNNIKFKSITIPLHKPYQSLLNLLTPMQRKLFVPSLASSPLDGKLYVLKPNNSLILNNFIRIDYEGLKPIHFTNFTKLTPLFFNTEELNTMVKSKSLSDDKDANDNNYNPNNLLKNPKPTNFPIIKKYKEINLPLIFSKSNSKVDINSFNFDITLNGLGWLSFNTKLLELEGLEGKIVIYKLDKFDYPITNARLKNWNCEGIKLLKVDKEKSNNVVGESENK